MKTLPRLFTNNRAWAAIHGWIYDIKDGLLRDLGPGQTSSADFDALTQNSITATHIRR